MDKIRQATVGDAVAIDCIWRQRLDEDQPPDEASLARFRKMLEEQDEVFRCWVLEADGEIVGWISLTPMRASPAIRNTMAETSIFVVRSERGGAYAFKLARYMHKYATETPLEWLWAFLGKSNRGVHGLAIRYGWKRISELPSIDKKHDRDVVELWVWPTGKIVSQTSPPPPYFS